MSESAAYEEQHLRLLEGLAEAIREKGLAQTQLTDIVRHARASRRTFYKHFPDKDACFVEMTQRVSEVALAHVAGSIDREAEWGTQLDQAIDAYLGIVAADAPLALTYASPSLGPTIVRAQRDGIEGYAQLLVDLTRTEPFQAAGAGISFDGAFMLVSGLHSTVVRAIERGSDPLLLAAELKAVFRSALESATVEETGASPRRSRARLSLR